MADAPAGIQIYFRLSVEKMAMRAAWLVLLLVPAATAHVPSFNEAGATPESAFVIDDPTKSWVFYDTLEGQHWFRFDMEQGTTLFASISLPAREVGRPSLWIVGPGFTEVGPAGTPGNLGAVQAEARDELSIEPFTPLAMRSTAEWRGEAPASGTYYVVVEAAGPVDYSVAIGSRESFTPVEWITVPVERIAIQAWGGVPPILAVAGEILGAAAAGVLVWKTRPGWRGAVGLVAAGIVAGTSLSTIVLATIAAAEAGPSGALAIPFAFALAAAGVGFGALRAVQRGRWRAAMGWAAAALVAWAGLVIGSVLLVGWALWERLQPKANVPMDT